MQFPYEDIEYYHYDEAEDTLIIYLTNAEDILTDTEEIAPGVFMVYEVDKNNSMLDVAAIIIENYLSFYDKNS